MNIHRRNHLRLFNIVVVVVGIVDFYGNGLIERWSSAAIVYILYFTCLVLSSHRFTHTASCMIWLPPLSGRLLFVNVCDHDSSDRLRSKSDEHAP